MFKQSDKQKFITTMANNIGYFNKDLTIKHVHQFLKTNTNFVPRQAVRKTANDSFMSFIELTGFVQIDKSLIQMYIGVPKGYPFQPPVFVLALDRKNFVVHDQPKLLQYHLIALQKNQTGQDFIRLRFPMLQKQWNPRQNTLNKVYINLIQMINRPPIIKTKQQQFRNNISFIPNQGQGQQGQGYGQGGFNNNNQNLASQKIQRLNSKQVTRFVGKMYTDMTELLINKQNLYDANLILDYNLCREVFLKSHLEDLNLKLIANRSKIQTESQILKKDIQEIQNNRTCQKLLQINQQENKKLNVLSQQQVLKQAEVKLRSKIQKQSSTKFSEYKKIMKILYDRMFDNQTKVLKLLK